MSGLAVASTLHHGVNAPIPAVQDPTWISRKLPSPHGSCRCPNGGGKGTDWFGQNRLFAAVCPWHLIWRSLHHSRGLGRPVVVLCNQRWNVAIFLEWRRLSG